MSVSICRLILVSAEEYHAKHLLIVSSMCDQEKKGNIGTTASLETSNTADKVPVIIEKTTEAIWIRSDVMNQKMKLPRNSPLINIPFGGLTSNMLRIVAVLLMLSDHIWATYMSFGNWMTYIGRMAFPIFAFQIAEGFVHTSNFKKYVFRLLGFALVTEIPFNLFYSSRWFNPFHQNVLFTLLLGLLAIYVIDKAKKTKTVKNILLAVLWLLLISVGATIGFVDYGFLGMLTVVMFYVLRDFPFAWLAQLVAMVLINIVFFEGQVFPVEILGKTFEIPSQGFAVFSLIPIWMYGGRKGTSGKILQYGFYAFYPVHMLILYLIKLMA